MATKKKAPAPTEAPQPSALAEWSDSTAPTICEAGVVRDRFHRYKIDGLGPFPGVTTVIKNGRPKDEVLLWWAGRLHADENKAAWETFLAASATDPEKAAADLEKYLTDWAKTRGLFATKRDEAAERGTQFHYVAGRYCKEQPIDWSQILPENLGRCRQFEGFLEAMKPQTIYLEAPCFNLAYGYAGAADWIGLMNGELWFLDFKTGDSLYDARKAEKKPDIYPDDHLLQLVALASCEFLYDTERACRVKMPDRSKVRLGVVHVTEQACNLWEWATSEEERETALDAFLVCKFLYDFAKGKPTPIKRT